MASLAVLAAQNLRSCIRQVCFQNLPCSAQVCVRHFAARKGTRMKLEKKKKAAKMEQVEDKPFVPYKILLEQSKKANQKKRCELGKGLKEAPVDNVYCTSFYKPTIYTFADAVKQHQESHHPTILNEPDALLSVDLELDMKLKKKNRFVENFTSVVRLPHDFNHQSPRRIMVICKKEAEMEQAKTAGAQIIGGLELVKMIQTGELSIEEFDHVVSTPDILPEIVPIRGVLKKKFPNRTKGNLGFEIAKMIDRLARGIEYSVRQDDIEAEYGNANIIIGRLSMNVNELEENLIAAVDELCSHRSLELGPFVRTACLVSPPSEEKLHINPEKYLPITDQGEGQDDDDDDDDEEERARN